MHVCRHLTSVYNTVIKNHSLRRINGNVKAMLGMSSVMKLPTLANVTWNNHGVCGTRLSTTLSHKSKPEQVEKVINLHLEPLQSHVHLQSLTRLLNSFGDDRLGH